jgi:hypothetical protein
MRRGDNPVRRRGWSFGRVRTAPSCPLSRTRERAVARVPARERQEYLPDARDVPREPGRNAWGGMYPRKGQET